MIVIKRSWSEVISYRSGAFLAVKFRQKYKSKGLSKPIVIVTTLLYRWTQFFDRLWLNATTFQEFQCDRR
ncbi:hypothetical protein [Nostoc sp.]|uniref:hypothetical protein n=1 Tax=Nostoc sp. TaxID=1180 RepID=UPI002FF6ADB6